MKRLEWLLSLERGKLTLAMLLIAVSVLSIVISVLWRSNGTKDNIHNTDTYSVISCESRITFLTDSFHKEINMIYMEQLKDLKQYKLKSDSIIANQREAIDKTNKIIQKYK